MNTYLEPETVYPDTIMVGESEVETAPATIKVLMVEPGKLAYEREIGIELKDLQAVVGGFIEPFYPFEEEVCIVCNDEGKFNGMRPCRAFYGEDGKMMDIVFGPFFICDCSTENFGSLSEEQLQRFAEQFRYPEHYYRMDGEIKAVRYDPTRSRDHSR
jgi:hypothetical protein